MIKLITKLLNDIFFLIKTKKIIKGKINKNSPRNKTRKPETKERKNIFFLVPLLIINNKNFKNNNEKKICKHAEEICPQIITFKGIMEKIIELIIDMLSEKKLRQIL